jgi:LPXTG-site transpeptidase (sortase) family protein
MPCIDAVVGRHEGMRSLRLLVALLLPLVAACSSDAAGQVGSRSPAAVAVATTVAETTTSAIEPAPPSVEELPAGEDAEGGGDQDPVLAGTDRRVRSASRRAPEGKIQPTGHIEIPKLGLSHPTYEGISLAVINHGPSHWPGTAEPGARGNTVFPGHRTTYTRPFFDIDKLVAGDDVIFTTPQGRFTYQVTETFVVGSRDTWIVDPTDEPTFTIFACHPKGSARQRYVVKGRLVSDPLPSSTGSSASAPPETTTTTTPPQDPPPPEERPGLIPGLP